MKRCIEVAAHLDPKYGGISASLPALARAVEGTGRFGATLVACEGMRGIGRLTMALAPGDVVHVHGLWDAHSAAAGIVAARTGKPLVVSAHGMLELWALANKRWKKRLYSAIIERPNLRRASCLRALTQAEAEDYRRFGLGNPVAVIPNGVDPPAAKDPVPFFDCFPELAGRRIVLFLGRIHYKKGLDPLCRAWAAVRGEFPDAQLVLAGPDFENTVAATRRLVEELGISEDVTFTGMLSGGLKWSALAAAEVFVLPSYSEGFPVAALEALASETPVILSRQCHLPWIAERDCGWLIDPDPAQVRDALAASLRMPAAALARLGENGRNHALQFYTWPAIGRQMADVYEWVLGGPKPASIEIME